MGPGCFFSALLPALPFQRPALLFLLRSVGTFPTAPAVPARQSAGRSPCCGSLSRVWCPAPSFRDWCIPSLHRTYLNKPRRTPGRFPAPYQNIRWRFSSPCPQGGSVPVSAGYPPWDHLPTPPGRERAEPPEPPAPCPAACRCPGAGPGPPPPYPCPGPGASGTPWAYRRHLHPCSRE